ncbi:MAG: Stk1 family PASTA domain-containing Ser/Thr kinase [Bacillota bacterium]|nr:Stk1 family PASTA domain-containing Ser/Thr kinase [Bacillota bacterium]
MSSRTLAGRYELLEKIGDGGMAVVYKGRDKLLNRFVAIKILKPELTKDVKFIDSFRRESQSAASLSHPNIVNVYDVGREGNIHYIVMELIEGKVLSDVIREEGPMKPRQVVETGKQVALALSHAHKNQIIHRDVKPHNILLMEDGTAKITDFGIAKAVNSATVMGNTGTIMGSVHYFSPEQARGGYVDEKSDIYSLGIVLYEMITGQVPFDAENPVAVALMHMNEEMPKPSELKPGIPKDLEDIIIKATNKYQINRFKSAEEMYEALDKARLSDILYYGGGTDKGLEATMVMAAVNRNGGGEGALPEDGGEGQPPAYDAGENGGQRTGNGNGSGGGHMGNGNKHGKTKGKKKISKTTLFIIIAALIVAIPLGILLSNLLSSLGQLEEVQVPDLVSMTVEEAEEALAELGLELEVGRELNNNEYEEGQIISQDPVAEMMVREGYTVTVNVSLGPAADTIPEVVGKTRDDAVFILESYGYVVTSVQEEYHEYPEDIIFRQSPEGGEEAEPGTEVTLYVSLGEETETVEMPDLRGKAVEEAQAEMEALELELGVSSFASSDEYEENQIISQAVEPGTEIEIGTAVDITVSTGPDLSGPVSIPVTIPYSSAVNDVFSLTVVVSDDSGVQTVINQEQRLKSNESETITLSGTGMGTVTVIFDNVVVLTYNVNFDTGAVN